MKASPGHQSLLPNFYILGAAKAGTTSLYELMKDHPQIYLPQNKEPQFFSNDNLFKKGLDYYLKTHFSRAEGFRAVGEATPHYLYYRKVAERLGDVYGDRRTELKFIVILRNPVDRAYSLYWNMVKEGVEEKSFEEALSLEEERQETRARESELGTIRYQYTGSGMYATQLNAYFDYFSRKQFLILFQEDLANDPRTVIRKICEFLDVNNYFPVQVSSSHNSAGVSRCAGLQRFLRGDSAFKRTLGKFVPVSVKYSVVNRLLSMNSKPMQYPRMQASTRSRLIKTYQEDIQQLQELTGRDLGHWLEVSR